ncbi:unnamed protein product [marine sediment metagenome]|uniref:Zona occludens toxin N-terminal domain-containing protein n=1 Tax=marine sediment metagenome TaxID=412755 RepID=X1FMM9_9ZZZZ
MKPPLQADPIPRLESLVTAITGPRGSGKTLLMTFLGIIDMKRGHQCLANYPIKGEVKRRGKPATVESLPLDFETLLELNENLQRCVCCIDEINLWFASTRWMTHGNRIFAIFMQLLRKRQMSLYYTTQNFKWADPTIRWQTDLQIACQDLFHTPQGKEEGVRRGEFIRFIAIDRSGYITGVPYEVSGSYSTGILDAKPIWKYYNTYEALDPWEALSKVELKRPTLTVDLTGKGPIEDKEDAFPDFGFAEEK